MCNTILKSDTSWRWFSTKGGFVPSSPRNRWQHLEALLVVRVGKGGIAADIYQAEAGMLLKRLTIHWTTATTKNSRAPNVHTATVEKPCCRVLCHHPTYIMPNLREIFEEKLGKYSCICFIDKILVLNICMWPALHLFICLVSLFIQLMCIYTFTLCRGSKYSHTKEE